MVFPFLTYPPIPLHIAAESNIGILQGIQSNALRWATNTKWYDRISNKKLHKKLNIRPINQELYWRARTTWENIRDNNAADRTAYQNLLRMDYNNVNPTAGFFSSYETAMGPEPRPIYN